jgi:hypothetical protein
MPVGPVSQKVFNALNGSEIKEMVFNAIRRQLDNDTQFTQNRTFPVVEWDFTLTIKAYPMEPPTQTTKVQGAVQQIDSHTQQEVKVQEEPSAVIDVAEGKSIEETKFPDKTREEAGLEVTKPTTIPGLGTFDKTVTPAKTPAKPGPAAKK